MIYQGFSNNAVARLEADRRTLLSDLQSNSIRLATAVPIEINWDLSPINHPNVQSMEVCSFRENSKSIAINKKCLKDYDKVDHYYH